MITDKKIYMTIGKQLNDHFGTLIPVSNENEISYIAFENVYDIYSSMREAIEDIDMDMSIKDLENNPLYYKVNDNIHVIFNDINYDFQTYTPELEWEPGEKELYRKLQIEQGLITVDELQTIIRREEYYEKILEGPEEEM